MDKDTEFLTRLVNIRSESFNEAEACACFGQALSSFGWGRAETDEAGNVIAQRGSGDKELVLMGHIDTVPGGPEARIEGNTLWGRGSVDAKGPLCALAAAGGLCQIPRDWKVTLIAAVGEEMDSRGARHIIRKYNSNSPAGCIIGEPSGTDGITIGYRGDIRVKLHARDGGAHRSRDAGPITATIHTASDILREVERMDKPDRPVIERPWGAIMSMEGKEAGERSAVVQIDVRLPLDADIEEYKRIFTAVADRHGVFIEHSSWVPAHMTDKNDPIARALRVAVRKEGLSPRIFAKGGTADFNLAAAWKCPMAAYGPGDSKLDHTNEEHLSFDSYKTSISILKNGIEGFFKQWGKG